MVTKNKKPIISTMNERITGAFVERAHDTTKAATLNEKVAKVLKGHMKKKCKHGSVLKFKSNKRKFKVIIEDGSQFRIDTALLQQLHPKIYNKVLRSCPVTTCTIREVFD